MPSSPDRPKRMNDRLVRNLGRRRFWINRPVRARAETVRKQEQYKSHLLAIGCTASGISCLTLCVTGRRRTTHACRTAHTNAQGAGTGERT